MKATFGGHRLKLAHGGLDVRVVFMNDDALDGR